MPLRMAVLDMVDGSASRQRALSAFLFLAVMEVGAGGGMSGSSGGVSRLRGDPTSFSSLRELHIQHIKKGMNLQAGQGREGADLRGDR